MTGAKLLRAGQRIDYPDQDEAQIVEAEHRDHAVVEQVIADLKDQALAHFPSEHFYASSAWTLHLRLAGPGTASTSTRSTRIRALPPPDAPDFASPAARSVDPG